MNLRTMIRAALVMLLALASPGVARSGEAAAKEQPISHEHSLEWLRTTLAAALEEAKQRKADLLRKEKPADAAPPAETPVPGKDGEKPPKAEVPPQGDGAEKREASVTPTAPAVPTAPAAPASAEDVKVARLAVLEADRRVRALETTIAAVRGARVEAKDAKEALSVLAELRSAAEREVSIESKGEAGGKPVPPSPAQVTLRHLDKLLEIVKAASVAADASVKNAQTQTMRSQLEFARGDRLQYGPTISLLRFNSSRAPDEPGRQRNYEPRLDLVPAEFGFQFVYEPVSRPWRLPRLDGKSFQLMSAGGILLAQIDKDHAERGAIGIAATLSFFDQVLGLGLGVDLYRGIPTLGANGRRGADTAYTGLLAWSFARDGELTPENVFFVVTLGLQPIISGLTGQVKP